MRWLLAIVFYTSLLAQSNMYTYQPIRDLGSVYKRYIYKDFVAYERLVKNKADMQTILTAHNLLASFSPTKMTRDEQFAYWINLYNICVIKMVIENYPLKSINDIQGAFQKKIITIEGSAMSLDDIERSKLASFKDPRHHFAVVCAAMSCPNIGAELYEPNRLNAQLERATAEFIMNPDRNQLDGNVIRLSQLFNWYKDEFKASGGIVAFVNRYVPLQLIIQKNDEILFNSFDWRINGEITARADRLKRLTNK